MSRLIRVTKPTEYPLTLAEAKSQLRIGADQTADDADIDAAISTGTAYAEGYLGRALVTQSWKKVINCFDGCRITLPLPPLQSVSSVTYLDSSGAQQTLATSVYRVLGIGDEIGEGAIELGYGQVWPVTYPVSDAVEITFVAGYGSAGVVPDWAKSAIKLHLTALYEYREPTKYEMDSYDRLMFMHKLHGFGA